MTNQACKKLYSDSTFCLGFELATAGWAALRAPQGLLLSSSARERGASAAMDVNETVAQLNAAQERAQTLSNAATAQQVNGLNANQAQVDFIKTIDPEQDGVYKQNVGGQDFNKHKPGTRDKDKPAERFATPSVLLDSPSSIAATTPASSLHYAGGNTHATTQGETQHSAAATHSSISGSTTSLFTHEGGAKAVAANGPLSLQAHDDKLEILADDSVTVTSSKERVNIFAQSKIVLTSGQSSITLEGGNVTFACPGTFTVKGGTHDFVGPGNDAASLAPLPAGAVNVSAVSSNGAMDVSPESATKVKSATETKSPDSQPQTKTENVGEPSEETPHSAERVESEYAYKKMQEPYNARQAAYLPAEGVGINGTYFLKGRVGVEGNQLTVTAEGNSAAQELGTVRFFASVEVLQDGRSIAHSKLELNGPSMWPTDSFSPIGSANISLPEPTSATKLQVKIVGGYTYSDSSGTGTPVPPTTEKDLEVEVVKK